MQTELIAITNQKRRGAPRLQLEADGPRIVEPDIETSPGAVSITRNLPMRLGPAWLEGSAESTWQYLGRARRGQPRRIRASCRRLALTAGIGTEMVVLTVVLARSGNRTR